VLQDVPNLSYAQNRNSQTDGQTDRQTEASAVSALQSVIGVEMDDTQTKSN